MPCWHKLDADKKLGHGLEQVASVAEVSVEDLLKAGFNTLDKLRAATDGELGEKLSLTGTRIAQLRAAINFLAPVVEKQPESSSVEFMNRPAADAAENAGQEEEDEPEPEEYGTDDPSAGTVDGTDDQDPSEAGFTDPDGEAKDGADDENGPEEAR